MAFNPLKLRFIRFLGPEKEPAEYTLTSGLNILWGASDTGKTFLVQGIDFMLGAGSLKDIPERVGYDRILLGITTAAGNDYTLQRSIDGGSFRRFDDLLNEPPKDKKAGKISLRSIRRRTTTIFHTGCCKRLASTIKKFCGVQRKVN